jgi:hypothetical protein
MTRRRSNTPPTGQGRRVRSGAPSGTQARGRARPREPVTHADLSEEELRALLDDNVDPDEVERVARDAVDDEQEASEHDRDTPRDRLEGLLFEQDDDV